MPSTFSFEEATADQPKTFSFEDAQAPSITETSHDEEQNTFLQNRADRKKQLQLEMERVRAEGLKADLKQKLLGAGEAAAYLTPFRGTATSLLLNQPDPMPVPPLVTTDKIKELAGNDLRPALQTLGFNPADLQDPVVQGAGDFAAETLSGLTTPDSLGLLASGAPGARVFQTEMIKNSPQAITAAVEANKKNGPLSAEAVKADLGAALSVAGPLGIERGLAKPSGVPKLERTGKSLDMPEGAKPVEAGTVQELQSNLNKATVEPLKPDMDSAHRIVSMSPDEFYTQAKAFNGINLELGRNASPEDVVELKKLRDQADERVNEAKAKAKASKSEADLREYGILSTAIRVAEEKSQPKMEQATAEPAQPIQSEAAKTHSERAKMLADKIREQFKTETQGQLFTGPVSLINAAVEIAAKIVEGGGKVADAVEAALKHLRENYKGKDYPAEVDEGAFIKNVQSAIGETHEESRGIYGIAERVRQERAKAGQVADIPPGKGISASDSVDRGRELKANGSDPEIAMAAFEKTKQLSSDDMALARAHGEDLAKEARRIEQKFGTDSPEHRAAYKALSDWDARSKTMQTEWHKTGMAQQGETDIDTGTFTGLQRAYRDATGEDFTPAQSGTAKKRARKVRSADVESETAKQDLLNHISKDETRTAAEKRAFDAANKTVREAAARLAEAERKAGEIDAERNAAVKKIQEESARRALDAAQKTIKEAAVSLANAQTKSRIAKTVGEREIAKVQEEVAKRAMDAANKTVTENAARLARKETVMQVREAARKKMAAERDRAEAKKLLEKANEAVRKAAVESARQAVKSRVAKADTSKYVWDKAREYIDRGMDDFDDIRNKLATDLGMTVKQVTTALAKDKRTKFLADDLWRKQQVARRLDQSAKQWLRDTTIPGYRRAIESVPKILFGLKVGFHGTVALGTHAPMVAFQPKFWSMYVRDFGKMYRMVGSRAYYEMQVQDLLRRPNYTTARRAGLVNDPFVYEDFNSPDIAKYVAGVTGMGNRGYSVLKILRQDMFDQHWNNLPKTSQIAELAQAIADGVNHATGVTQKGAPKSVAVGLFAPRLEASRVAWLAVDPAKSLATFLDWKNASEGDKYFAVQQVKEKAWVAGTMFGLLALNQGILSAVGSDQKINGLPQSLGGNGFDPMESDFLKFKVAGMDVSYGNAMVAMARLPERIGAAIMYEGKMSKIVLEDERVGKVVIDYVRSQMSPFAGTTTDLAIGRDFAGRPLPRAGFGLLPGRKDIPKRLQKHGVTDPYSWSEYSAQQFTPIPISEGIKEVWGKGGLRMSDDQIKHTMKAFGVTLIMMGTGGRISEDWNLSSPESSLPAWAGTK